MPQPYPHGEPVIIIDCAHPTWMPRSGASSTSGRRC